MDVTADRALDFVRRLDLPEAGPRFESALPRIPEGQAVIAVGSQLIEFDRSVAAEARMPVANSMLLAQLAANKAASRDTDVQAWFARYNEVLQGIGWQVGNFDMQEQTIRSRQAQLHEEIIPVLAGMVGPAVASSSMVIAVLRGVQAMDKESRWIRLFERNSQHASGAKFQVSYIDADAEGNPQINAVSFAIVADSAVTQVLFFRFSSARAHLKLATTQLSASAQLLRATDKVIADRVTSFATGFIANVAI